LTKVGEAEQKAKSVHIMLMTNKETEVYQLLPLVTKSDFICFTIALSATVQ